MKNRITNQTSPVISKMGFGFFDKKNREIGMQAVVFECDVVEAEPDACWWTRLEQGHYYVAIAQATRNGERFGAGQPTRHFKTREERDVYLAKRWDDSLKSASKRNKTKPFGASQGRQTATNPAP